MNSDTEMDGNVEMERYLLAGQPLLFWAVIGSALSVLLACLVVGYLFHLLESEMAANRELATYLLTIQADRAMTAAPISAGETTPTAGDSTDLAPRLTTTPSLTPPFTSTPDGPAAPEESPTPPPAETEPTLPPAPTAILEATIAVAVIVQDDDYFVTENSVLDVGPAEGVLRSDRSVNAGELRVTSNFTQPSYGVVVMNQDGSFSYTPQANYYGPDFFTYEVCGATPVCAVGRVNITVRSMLFAVDTVAFFDEDEGPRDITNELLHNDGDKENSPISIISVQGGDPDRVIFIRERGVVQYDPGDHFIYLGEGETATESFQYTIQNTRRLTSTARVTITIRGKNNPPLARDDHFTLLADRLSGPLQDDMLANDFDPDLSDHSRLTVASISNSDAGGTASLVDGEVRYDPRGAYETLRPGQTATDSFTYTIVDPQGAESNAATAHITIQGVNDPPQLTIANMASPVPFSSTLASSVAVAEMVEIVDPDSERMIRAEISFAGSSPRPDGQDEYLQLIFQGSVITSVNDFILIHSQPLLTQEYINALETTLYVNDSPAPTDGCRQIRFQVFDAGGKGSNAVTVYIQVNNGVCPAPPAPGGWAPPLNNTPALQEVPW